MQLHAGCSVAAMAAASSPPCDHTKVAGGDIGTNTMCYACLRRCGAKESQRDADATSLSLMFAMRAACLSVGVDCCHSRNPQQRRRRFCAWHRCSCERRTSIANAAHRHDSMCHWKAAV
eukprot:TRINITY_DN20612_c0_g1_i1.p1 TRINITY_DN20612_c0_g1~~TRINITY_DN20612_c0_g1_i1.p1  ORF type:complete len:119 (-),score=9.45 TRINITY_DN20612_c0_g1_i1:13-369(-)